MSYTEKGPRLNILNNTLVIKENNVELVTDFNYRIIDIRFSKNLSIESKLPSDYLFRKTTNRLLIIKVNNRDEIIKELFNYFGECRINQIILYDDNKNSEILYIDNSVEVSWDNLISRYDIDGNETVQAWENLTTNYEDLIFTGRNDYKYVKTPYKEFNETTKINETKYEIKKTKPSLNKKDKKINVLGNLYNNGTQYTINGKNQAYSWYYHVNLITRQIMTVKEYTKESKVLVPFINSTKPVQNRKAL